MIDTWNIAVKENETYKSKNDRPRQKGIDDNDSWLDEEHLNATSCLGREASAVSTDYLRSE